MSQSRNDTGMDPLDAADRALLSELLPPLDDRPGPARRRAGTTSEATVKSLVELALSQRELPTVVMDLPEIAPRVTGRGPLRTRGRTAMLIAASLALFSLGAAGAVLVARVTQRRVEAPPAPAHRSPRPSAAVAEAPVAPPEEVLEAEPVVEIAPEVAVVPPPATSRRRTVRVPRHRTAPKAASPAAASSLEEVDLERAPLEDLLALANHLRRGHDWGSADEVYRAVVARFPGSDAAVVAEIASSTLHVEQLRDPSGALEGYRRALAARPTGALAEEARWGIVEALRALKDTSSEAAALREFLERHPVSALAPAARRRVAELGR